jgi:endonuclease/exonuclease/phosphatase family metal-dependent hydrolase
LLSYNVRSLRDDKAAVAAVIGAGRPDVVAVQEAPRFLRWRSKRAALARESGLLVATADRPGGLLILTSLAVRVRRTSFALLPKTPRLHQRAVCIADVELGGVAWRIASVHFSLDPEERQRHLPSVWAAVDAGANGNGSPAGPLVVAGDINEGPNRPVWRELAGRLQDAFAVAGSDRAGDGDTYSTVNRRKRIDGIFAAPEVEVVDCRVVTDLPDAATVARASDHYPLLATLRHRP